MSTPGFSEGRRCNQDKHPECDRIQQGIGILEWQPSFPLEPDGKVFSIESCFSRNIEIELYRVGVVVTSFDPESEAMELRTNHQLELLNKYNPVSIHQELECAAEIAPFSEAGLLE